MDVADEPSLRQLFEAGWEAQRKIESGETRSNTDDYKVCLLDFTRPFQFHFWNGSIKQSRIDE